MGMATTSETGFLSKIINALIKIANDGENGARYCIGGGQEIPNIELVKLICEKMDKNFIEIKNH